MKYLLVLSTLISSLIATSTVADSVGISDDLFSIEVTHNDKTVVIQRNQDTSNIITPAYARTSRNCPPFCIQPIKLAEGVETIGELELLYYLKAIHEGNENLMVIDSRTPDWVKKGTIPGSVNIPWTKLNPAKGADPFEIADILENSFNARATEGLWNFDDAKILILFCNGMWCGQSPSNIKSLLSFGYPAHKIKWYRGGMQNWHNLGLTVIK